MRAFQGAIDLGCRYIETDVHLTRDDEIVVFHDHRLERTTNGAGFVRDYELTELRRLDAGYRYTKDGTEFPFRGQGIQIPTFVEAITLDPNVRYNVELKERGRGLPQAFWKLVERHGLHRVLVAAFDDSLVRDFRRLSRKTVATSAGQRETVAFWLAARARATRLLPIHYDALQVPPTQSKLAIVNQQFVGAAHARGLAVHVWTIDEAREMRRLLDLGVDGIMSDRPDTLIETLATR